MTRQRFEGAQGRVTCRLQGATCTGKLLQARLQLSSVMSRLRCKERHRRSPGDIVQLGEQRREGGLVVGSYITQTTHAAVEELATVELNGHASTQPCTFYVDEQTAIRPTSSNCDALAEHQAGIEAQRQERMHGFDRIVAVDLLETTGLHPAISAQYFQHRRRPAPPHLMDDRQAP